ncbi:MAG: hypothetical protein IMW98_06200, partial [Firmicutes bacterium]|nr:hypothetical protein [Bacillota bacterium]
MERFSARIPDEYGRDRAWRPLPLDATLERALASLTFRQLDAVWAFHRPPTQPKPRLPERRRRLAEALLSAPEAALKWLGRCDLSWKAVDCLEFPVRGGGWQLQHEVEKRFGEVDGDRDNWH